MNELREQIPHDLGSLSTAELRLLCARIGDTPMMTLGVGSRTDHRLILKLESQNPSGSIKDRPALQIVQDLEDAGRINPGDLIVDSTSGNFGVSMAWVCKAKGYRFYAVTDPNVSQANLRTIDSLGGTVETVSTRDEVGGYFLTRYRRAAEIVADGDAAFWSDQYANPSNPLAHYNSTGPEILAQLSNPPDAVLIPASTGGTLAGISRFLREKAPGCEIVAVDGEGSSMFGGVAGPRSINGLGNSQQSQFLAADDYDRVIRVTTAEALSYARAVSPMANVGGSSGAVIAAAVALMAESDRPLVAVCICPDHGSRYLDTIFDDSWIARHPALVETVELAVLNS